MRLPSIFFIIVASLALTAGRAEAQVIVDPNFSTPSYNPGNVEYSPGVTGWTFNSASSPQNNGGTGIAGYECGFGDPFPSPGPPSGSQYAFLQGGAGGPESFYQQGIAFPAGSFTISFYDAASSNADPFQVTLENAQDDIQTLTFGGDTTLSPGNSLFELQTSDPFLESAGTYTLSFTGEGGSTSDRSFIDGVQVNAVPEPANWIAPLLAIVGGLFVVKRRNAPNRLLTQK